MSTHESKTSKRAEINTPFLLSLSLLPRPYWGMPGMKRTAAFHSRKGGRERECLEIRRSKRQLEMEFKLSLLHARKKERMAILPQYILEDYGLYYIIETLIINMCVPQTDVI